MAFGKGILKIAKDKYKENQKQKAHFRSIEKQAFDAERKIVVKEVAAQQAERARTLGVTKARKAINRGKSRTRFKQQFKANFKANSARTGKAVGRGILALGKNIAANQAANQAANRQRASAPRRKSRTRRRAAPRGPQSISFF